VYDQLASDLRHPDRVIRGHAWSQLERSSRSKSDLAAYREAVFDSLEPDEDWAIRLQIVRLLPRFEWSRSETAKVVEYLLSEVRKDNLFIRAWALDSLSIFALREVSLREEVVQLSTEALGSGSAAVKVRARKALQRLSG